MPHRAHRSLGLLLADRVLLAALVLARVLLAPWPMRWRIRFGGWAGHAAGRLTQRRRLAINNLKRAFRDDPPHSRAQLERIADLSYRDLGRSMTEFLASPGIDHAYFDSHIELEGEERLAELIRQGRGVVLLTGHFGNWEFLNLMAGVRGHELAVLAKPQKLRASDAYLNRLRVQRGAKIILRGMDLRRVYRTLAAGGLAGVLADQDGGGKGIYAPLFGRASSYPRGVARFSHVTGAPAVPVFCARVALDRHRIHIGHPIAPQAGESEAEFERRVVGDFSRQLEAMVRRYPTQWMWSHRRWKSSPDRDLLVLEDGRKGHENQSLAVATRVAERRAATVHPDAPAGIPRTRIRSERIEFRSPTARALLTAWGIVTRGGLWGGRRCLKWALTADCYERLLTAPADGVISCGTATEAVNLILSRDCGARSCYIHKPQFGGRYFSAVLVPGHDRAACSPNTVRTGGALSGLDPARLASLRAKARSEAGISDPSLAVAVLIGGPSKHAPWEPAELERAFFALRDLSREHKIYLLVTTSRRTDAAVESAAERAFVGEPFCPVLILAGRSNPSSAYEGILAAADRILVTADSVSMVSEAVSTAKAVGLIATGVRPIRAGKFARFIRGLEKTGSASWAGTERLRAFLSQGPAVPGPDGSPDPVALAAERLAI